MWMKVRNHQPMVMFGLVKHLRLTQHIQLGEPLNDHVVKGADELIH
jgi:hypothetical protein